MMVESLPQRSAVTTRQILWGLVGALGGLSLLGGLAGIVLAFVLRLDAGDTTGVTLAGVGLILLIFGGGLLWAGVTGWQQSPSPSSYPRWLWLLFLGLSIALFIVGAFIPASRHTHPAFALLHLGVMLFPALTLVSLILLAAGRAVSPTLRQMVLTVVGGATSVVLALPLELIGLVLCILVVAIVAYIVPGGAAEVTRLTELTEQWMMQPLTDPTEAIALVSSPLVLSVLALLFAVTAPLIEEFCKTLVLGLMGIWHRPGLAEAFLWGALCGLGFAVLESVTNGAMGLGEVIGWLFGAGARLMATGMHVLTSGFLGLGWAGLWQRRWWALPLAYCAAVLYHGLWNFNIILVLGGAALGATASQTGYVLAIIGAGFELILLLGMPLLLFGIPSWLRRRAKQEA